MTTKQQRIINLLEEHGIDGLLLNQVGNFAWATDGAASYINTASSYGTGTLLITRNARYLITNTIEAPRFEQEEGLKEDGWEFHVEPWYSNTETLMKLTKNYKLGADFSYPGAIDLTPSLAIARSHLDHHEQTKFRILSKLCAQAMEEAIHAIKPGMTEYQIAGILSQATLQREVQPIVNLVATDERVYKFRHPLPTGKVLNKYAMLVLCGRKNGLVCSITRLIHFGPLSEELVHKSTAVAAIDAAMIVATRPGATLSDIFAVTKDAYANVGFSEEYELHHQGGLAGYTPREVLANPSTSIPVEIGQVFAWNPSITGCKSEDTILVGEDTNEILTAIDGWPTIPVSIEGKILERPAILVVDE